MAQPTLITKTASKEKTSLWPLLGILGLALVARLVLFAGLNGSDDIEYFRFADNLLHGRFHLIGYSHANRWGIILPLALSYKLLGVSEASTCVWMILASLGEVWVAYAMGKMLIGHRAGLLAAALLAVYPLDICWSTQGLPEALLAFCLGLSVLLYMRGSMEERRKQWYFLGAGLLFGLGYLAKETAVLLLPFYLGYALWRRQFRISAPWALVGWLLVLAPEMLFYALRTGNSLFRILGASSTNAESMATGYFDQGYFHYFYLFLANLPMNGFYYYALAGSMIAAWRLRERRLIPVALWIVLLFLPMEFGIESFSPITPIHKEVKTLTMLSIPLVVCLGWWFDSLIQRRKRRTAALATAFLMLTGLGMAWIRVGMLSGEWNALRAALPAIRATEPAPLYTDNLTTPNLQFFLGFREDARIRPFNHPDLNKGGNTLKLDLSQLHGAVVVLNHRVLSGSYPKDFNVTYPPEIMAPPRNWEHIGTYPAKSDWLLVHFLSVARRVADFGFVPSAVSSRAKRALDKAVDMGTNRVDIYRIP